MQRLEYKINSGRLCIEPADIAGIARQVDDRSARLLWYIWAHRHASLGELKRVCGDSTPMKVLMRIRETVNPAARRTLGRPIVVFERSALDYYTGAHVLHSWWLNEGACGPARQRRTPSA